MARRHCALVLLVCAALCGRSDAECCTSSMGDINLRAKVFSIADDAKAAMDGLQIGTAAFNNIDVFRYPLCFDGRHREGMYCGKGPCNIFGCNCDGGCLSGHNHLVGKDPITFVCAHDAALQDNSVETFVNHPDCSCIVPFYNQQHVASLKSVVGPEVAISNPLSCSAGSDTCNVQVTHVRSFEVTQTLSSSVSVPLPDVVELSMGVEISWAETTGTETAFGCTVKGGNEVTLTVEPMYIEAKVLELAGMSARRPRCSISTYYVPQTMADKSIKGKRRCVTNPTKK